MKKNISLLFTLTMLCGALVGCEKTPETNQLTITMVTHEHVVFITRSPEQNIEYAVYYDDKMSVHPPVSTITVDYTTGDTYRDVLMDSIFIVEPARIYDDDPSTWQDDYGYVEFTVYCVRYGYTPHFSLKSDMSDMFLDWNKEVTGNEIFISVYR